MIVEINIGGQLRTLAFNNYAKEALGRLYGVDPMESTRKLAAEWGESILTVACDVIYAGLVGQCRLNRTPVDFTIQDVSGWVAEGAEAEIGKALNAWSGTEEVRKLIKGSEGKRTKKK